MKPARLLERRAVVVRELENEKRVTCDRDKDDMEGRARKKVERRKGGRW